ncbi:glycosyltransferase [Heyndrickxia sporothermodurans]|uniref:glycosyltransferase n=1 Tax=Heyndrickxia sporothermodurans TaxID=46224 RepID=UPI002E1EDB87|nr:glycosyltransferase [Heyndrickxia sporothermodurans]
MDNNIVVSVCVLTYNHEKYLRQALESILMQKTTFKYEILIHDDASTDSTQTIIREYALKYPEIIKPILQKENQYSKKIGIYHTYVYPNISGKYVAYCEGDDYWIDSEKLQKQVDFLEKYPQYIATTHECWEVDKEGNMISKHYFYGNKKRVFTLKTHLEKNFLSGQTATLMLRREAILLQDPEIIKLYGELQATGDVKTTLLTVLKGDIYHTNEVMSHHRRIYNEGDSWSAKNSKKNLSVFYFNECFELARFAKQAFDKDIDYSKMLKRMARNSCIKFLINPSKEKWETFMYMYKSLNCKSKIIISIILCFFAWPFMWINKKLSKIYYDNFLQRFY